MCDLFILLSTVCSVLTIALTFSIQFNKNGQDDYNMWCYFFFQLKYCLKSEDIRRDNEKRDGYSMVFCVYCNI